MDRRSFLKGAIGALALTPLLRSPVSPEPEKVALQGSLDGVFPPEAWAKQALEVLRDNATTQSFAFHKDCSAMPRPKRHGGAQ